jgi:Tol biopolymer transport system component
MLNSGPRLGAYEVREMLGHGGMGEVYRARDTRLKRDVALKVLAAPFAGDAERLTRFAREGELLAALNHPHIAAIYGIEESHDVCALVMEIVEGPTLEDRLAAGPLAVAEVVGVARQLVDALAAAHDAGIVHRDLKPANIKIRPDGTLKVLDFGIAKMSAAAGPADLRAAVTTESALTREGAVLGTAAYMSPEQARGAPVDRRADVWAFGCVLFEMLTGRRAFDGHATADALAAVLTREPDWQRLPAGTPAAIRRLLSRCLEKDPQRRLRDIADARFELVEANEAHETEAVPALQPARRAGLGLVLAAVGMLAGGALAYVLLPRDATRTPAAQAGRFSIAFPESLALGNLDQLALAISPDGKRIAFVAGAPAPSLYIRELNDPTPRAIPGTDGAAAPFFSPDSELVAFFAQGRVKKVAARGGDVITVCDGASNPRGGAWSVDGTIAFTPAPGSALFKVSAEGGTPQPFTKLDVSRGEGAHHWSEFLPDGKSIIYTVGTGRAVSWDERDIMAESLTTGERHVVIQGSAARYVEPGFLVVARGGALSALPFDPKTLRTTGAPVRLTDGVMQSAFGATQFGVSRTGTFVYAAGGINTRELVWYSRQGAATPLPTPGQTYWSVRLSPDAQRLALGVEAANYGVWVWDLVRGTMTRQTFEGTNAYPIWTPDGTRLTYNSTKSGGVLNLFWRPADGSGDDERLAKSDRIQIANSWSPDGTVLAFQEGGLADRDIWLLTPGKGAPRPFLQTRFAEGGAQFTPDGRWIAYVSNESGSPNVYVRPYPGPGEKLQISSEGGGGPVWSRDGRELFYRLENRVLAVDMRSGSRLQPGSPRLLFEAPLSVPIYQADYDVSADGQRFIMIRPRGIQQPVTRLELGLNAVTSSPPC